MNDDSYPVPSRMVSRRWIDHFPQLAPAEQRYALFTRYTALLVDPYSEPDAQGRYYDFSAVRVARVFQDAQGLWCLPRVPLEDVRKLRALVLLAERLGVEMPTARHLLARFQLALQSFVTRIGAEHCHHSLLDDTCDEQAAITYRQWRGKHESGALLAIFASLIFSVMNALVKTIADDIPTGEIVFFRSSIGCLLVLLLMYRHGVAFSREDRPLLVLRGTMGGLYLICYFYSIAHLTLADASMLAYLSPFFSILLSLLVLRERISANTAFWLALVIIGAVLLVRPWHFSTYTGVAGWRDERGVCRHRLSVGQQAQQTPPQLRDRVLFPVYRDADLAAADVERLRLAQRLPVCHPARHRPVSLLGQVVLTRAFSSDNLIVVSVVRYIGIVFNIARAGCSGTKSRCCCR